MHFINKSVSVKNAQYKWTESNASSKVQLGNVTLKLTRMHIVAYQVQHQKTVKPPWWMTEQMKLWRQSPGGQADGQQI